jgi:hypothetical protein
MEKFVGNSEDWKTVRAARPGDPTVYINMDAIDQLPEEFQAVISVVKFNKEQDFTNVGTKATPSWYPGTRIMYDIAEKRGISSAGDLQADPIMEEVDISTMEMENSPRLLKKKVGYKVVKSGTVVQEDGTLRGVSRVSMENAWDEAVGLWNKEAAESEGYSKTVEDQYHRKGYEKTWNGKKEFHEYRYDTKWKRRVHFDNLLDKALGKAETKAKEKVIRELSGLKTGFTDGDLASGKFYFVKIVRSSSVLKLETAARIDALRQGVQPSADPSRLLFEAKEDAPIVAQGEAAEPPREAMIRKLRHYDVNGMIPVAARDTATKLLGWLSDTENASDDLVYWPKAKAVLEEIEKAIPDDLRLK